MPRTPDSFPGERFEDGLVFDEREDGIPPTEQGGLRYVSGSFLLRDSVGVFNPRSGSTGITNKNHRTLRQLIHLADGGGPFEGFSGSVKTTDLSPFPSASIWYTDATLTSKIMEKNITRNSNYTLAMIEWKVYDTDGSTVLATVTDTITYSGIFEIERTRNVS